MATKNQEQETIKVLDRALFILDTLMAKKQPLGVNEIAKLCDINLSTAFRTLKTLEGSGWVFQCQDDKYIPGEKLSYITEKDNFWLALKEVAHFTMCKLTESENQAMNLAIRQYGEFIIIHQSRTQRLIDYVPPIGTKVPAHASAVSKILIGGLPEILKQDIINSIKLESFTPNTICRRSDFIKELEKVSEQRYAVDFKESIENSCCISVPVFNKNQDIVAALSFSGILDVSSEDQLLYYLPILQEASDEITRKLYTVTDEYSASSQ